MENDNENGKIGCRGGQDRTKIIDPNDFNGFNSSTNMSVPLEDLNISVTLKTTKKARTVLITTEKESTATSTGSVSVRFIEGTLIKGADKKEKISLTTKYTDLTTIFEKGVRNNETLGITNVEIDFNSSYAPQITINFVDVRGSSIFQNESDIAAENSANKYSTFFQIPYPIFELEIKGYYGKPVTYCLHMIKFNSKFNSQTGNFEMQCEFVGYTYAMLSDLLIGYLKVIPKTEIGKKKYEAYNANKNAAVGAQPVLTLHDLVMKLQNLNEGLEREAGNSANAVDSVNCEKGVGYLEFIEGLINELGNTFTETIKNGDNKISKFKYIPFLLNLEAAKKSYSDNVAKTIKSFNELNLGITLKIEDFTSYPIHSDMLLSFFSKNVTTEDEYFKKYTDNLEKYKDEIFRFLTENFNLGTNPFIMFDMSKLFDKITETKTILENKTQDSKKALAAELANKVTAQLNFSPTVRNIVEIYTAACEVFLESIYEVSTEAEKKGNEKRLAQLKSKFNFIENSDLPSVSANSTFYAWPAYKQKDINGVYVEKYLGDPSVGLEHPEDIDEIKFIEDLFQAFIIAAQEEANAERGLNNETKLWLPINPIDTTLFTSTDPYGRIEASVIQNIIRLATIRGMTFLGYSNDGTTLTTKEIVAMGQAEADNILRSVDIKSLQFLIPQITEVSTDSSGTAPTKAFSKTLNPYINSTGVINGSDRKVIIPDEFKSGYFYNYIHELKTTKVFKTQEFGKTENIDFSKTKNEAPTDAEYLYQSIIPINDRFNQANWPTKFNELVNLHNNENALFLTNYSSTSTVPKLKQNDGGTYIKIFNSSEFNQITSEILLNELPENASTESIIDLKQLELPRSEIYNKLESVGFNVLGGPLGIQEYSTLKDYHFKEPVKVLYLFYTDDYKIQQCGVSNSRNQTLPEKLKNGVVMFDVKAESAVKKFGTQTQYYKTGISKTAVPLHNLHGRNRTILNLQANFDNSFEYITYPYIEQPLYDSVRDKVNGEIRAQFDSNAFSLFGSKLYYAQKDDFAKAFLFLNNLPFNKGLKTGSPFENNEIINLFNMRGGFIHAPTLWCAWIGSILWRRDTSDPIPENGRIIGGGSGPNDPIRWWFNGEAGEVGEANQFKTHPNRYQYLTCVNVNNNNTEVDYLPIGPLDIMINMPVQAMKEFMRIFYEFVNGSWVTLKDSLEIWSGDYKSFNKYVDDFNNLVSASTDRHFSQPKTTFLKNEANYAIISPVVYPGGTHLWREYLFLELAGNGKNVAVKNLIYAMANEVVIANNSYEIWKTPHADGAKHKPIFVSNGNFNLYFKALNNRLVASKVGYGETDQKKEIINSIFGTTNESIIKLNLYKHCKNIYDKWLGGTTNPADIMFKCGASKRNSTDGGLALKYGNKSAKFIDSFRFVNRSFRDIGDLLYINPIPINDYLTENQNASVYDSVSSILASNNFDFIALPTFINFHDDEELKAIFKPYPDYGQAIKEGSCGPAFVCVYTGEKSKHLAIVDSEYPNDGFDLRCTKAPTTATDNDKNNADKPKTGELLKGIPNDFLGTPKDATQGENKNKFEDPIGVFTVKYSQQNQNIFKDISLDQSEFTETEESIKIMDDISQKGAETNRTLAGQNLYGVYSVRSYKAEVEMMGNAMIQPMMYFQLDNIPMFHGAYMIIRVKHSIKPNHMSTNFTGVRIKYSETPLITASDVYMSLIDTLDLSSAVDTSAGNFRGNGLSASDLANLKTVKCNAIGKTVTTFTEVLQAVVAYLEGNYCAGGVKCGDKPNNIRSGETLWGLDRKNHKGPLDDLFWAKADTYSKSKWGYSYPTPYTEETLPLFNLYVPIFEKQYKAFSKKYYKNQAVRTLVESDGRLYFNLVYAVYNGEAYFKGLVLLMEGEYSKGSKTSDTLLQAVVNDRVSGLQRAYLLAQNHKLGQDAVTKLARTGVKIEKLVGLASTCK